MVHGFTVTAIAETRFHPTTVGLRGPHVGPVWDINKVLRFIDDLPINRTIEKDLQICAFLPMLATDWRISELHACVRQSEFCRIIQPRTLLIRPHPSFLAKNECPRKRWSHFSIGHLTLPSGEVVPCKELLQIQGQYQGNRRRSSLCTPYKEDTFIRTSAEYGNLQTHP